MNRKQIESQLEEANKKLLAIQNHETRYFQFRSLIEEDLKIEIKKLKEILNYMDKKENAKN